jgi:hypothetical protein
MAIYKIRGLLALGIAALLCGCATTIRVESIASDGQEQIYRNGVAALVSKKNVVVAVSPAEPTRRSNQNPRFVVSMLNTSPVPIDLDSTNVAATSDGKAVHVYTYEEVVADIQRRQAIAAALTAVGGALQAASAAQAASSRSYNGTYTVTSSNYNTYGSGTYSGSVYDPAAGQAAAAAVNAQTNANMAAIRANGEAALSDAAQTLLKRQTVFPQSNFGGVVMLGAIDVPDAGDLLLIRVTIGGDEHTFAFRQRRDR